MDILARPFNRNSLVDLLTHSLKICRIPRSCDDSYANNIYKNVHDLHFVVLCIQTDYVVTWNLVIVI